MLTEIYNKIQIEFPDSVESMTEDEIQQYYHNNIPDNAWIDRDSKSIMCTLMQDSVHLERKDVKNRITEYEAYYSRMCPGYQRGEVFLRRGTTFNMGIMSYKSNTPDSMRFNVLAVMNHCDKEVLINLSCDVANAFDELPKFTNILQSVNVLD